MVELNFVQVIGLLEDEPQISQNRNYDYVYRFKLVTHNQVMKGPSKQMKRQVHICIASGQIVDKCKDILEVGEWYQISGALDYQLYSGNHTATLLIDQIEKVQASTNP